MPKSAIIKRDNCKEPEIKVLDKALGGYKIGSAMLISSPKEIDALIRTLPAGTTISIAALRDTLAARYQVDFDQVDFVCSMSFGIFLRIVCQAALEERAQGLSPAQIAPFWRVDIEQARFFPKLGLDEHELEVLRALDGA